MRMRACAQPPKRPCAGCALNRVLFVGPAHGDHQQRAHAVVRPWRACVSMPGQHLRSANQRFPADNRLIYRMTHHTAPLPRRGVRIQDDSDEMCACVRACVCVCVCVRRYLRELPILSTIPFPHTRKTLFHAIESATLLRAHGVTHRTAHKPSSFHLALAWFATPLFNQEHVCCAHKQAHTVQSICISAGASISGRIRFDYLTSRRLQAHSRSA